MKDRLTPAARKQRTQIARAVQRGDQVAAEEARRVFKAIKLEDYIRRVVDDAPELTTEQRARLAQILAPQVTA